MNRLGKLFILSGPSGVGKSTARARLIQELGLVYSISATTRNPRPGELEAGEYEFISADEFQQRIDADQFLEWARVFGRGYGTPKKALLDQISRGHDVLLEIDVQGASQVRTQQNSLNTEVYYIFLLPPSLDELKRRQQIRATDSRQEIKKRLDEALREMAHAHEYDLIAINRNIEETVRVIAKFIHSARGV